MKKILTLLTIPTLLLALGTSAFAATDTTTAPSTGSTPSAASPLAEDHAQYISARNTLKADLVQYKKDKDALKQAKVAGSDTTTPQQTVDADKAKLKSDRAAIKDILKKIKTDSPKKKSHKKKQSSTTPTSSTITGQ